MAKSVKKVKPLTRSIYFYRVVPKGPAKQVDLAALVKEVDGLTWGPQRYWGQPSGDDVGLWCHDPAGKKFVLANIRRAGFPRSENAGQLSDLVVGPGSGLHEAVHAVLFDHNIVGFEFNFYGPRPSRLPLYLEYARPLGSAFELEALMRGDAMAQLDKQKEIRVVDLQISRGYSAKVASANKKLGRALEELKGVSDAEVVGIVLRPEPRGRKALSSSTFKRIKKIAKLDDVRENASVFRVKGVDELSGRVTEVDLLSDRLVSTREVVRQGSSSNAVDASSAFAAIESAYKELKSELLTASGVSVIMPDGDGGDGS